jgi:hypothetical protein
MADVILDVIQTNYLWAFFVLQLAIYTYQRVYVASTGRAK